MIDAIANFILEVVIYFVGRSVIWILTLGRYKPDESHQTWISLVGLLTLVGLFAVVIFCYR
ncbi:MAG: hypothetical protein KDH15_21125 [Rhodocyclaceae bacterium]|nr:hypothetical protein [Rhodocyclaceae bacterium]